MLEMHRVSSRQSASLEVQPVIAEILRTCVYPPTINLRVEQVVQKRVEYSENLKNLKRHGYVSKLLLTDGELVVQALLHRKLSSLQEIETLDNGDIVEIHKFTVKKARRTNGRGQVVYLGIENCYVIKSGQHVRENAADESERDVDFASRHDRAGSDPLAGGFFPNDAIAIAYGKQQVSSGTIQSVTANMAENNVQIITNENGQPSSLYDSDPKTRILGDPLNKCRTPRTRKRNLTTLYQSKSDGEADDFETVKINLSTAKKRRQTLHNLSQNVLSSPSRPPTRGLHESESSKDVVHENPRRTNTVRFETNENDHPRKVADVANSRTLGWSENTMNPVKPYDPVSLSRQDPISSNRMFNETSTPVSRPTTPVVSDSQADLYGPYHTLSSLYSPSLPSKSYVFTTLAIPTYISSHLIARPNSPFPPKRHIKVVDPSLASRFTANKTNLLGKGITVSVYRDAANFKPLIGKVALMRGVVMQRISGAMRNGNQAGQGEVILNVYPVKSRIQKQSQSSGQRYHKTSLQTSAQSDGDRFQIGGDKSVARPNALANGTGTTVRSESQTMQTETDAISTTREAMDGDLTEGCWYIDDHVYLKQHGYDVHAMQKWWDATTATK